MFISQHKVFTINRWWMTFSYILGFTVRVLIAQFWLTFQCWYWSYWMCPCHRCIDAFTWWRRSELWISLSEFWGMYSTVVLAKHIVWNLHCKQWDLLFRDIFQNELSKFPEIVSRYKKFCKNIKSRNFYQSFIIVLLISAPVLRRNKS